MIMLSLFAVFLLLLLEDVLLDLQFLVDQAFGTLGDIAGYEEFIEYKVCLSL